MHAGAVVNGVAFSATPMTSRVAIKARELCELAFVGEEDCEGAVGTLCYDNGRLSHW